MAEPKQLTMGVDSPSPSWHEEESRVATLEATVKHYLPDFAKVIAEVASSRDESLLVLHQDAFAAGYHDDEYSLLGMAIQYAGLRGVTLNIIGKNRQTF